MFKNRCRRRVSRLWTLVGLVGSLFTASVFAQTAPEAKKEPPEIAVLAPFAVMPNSTTKILVRGWRLSDASEVRLGDGKITAKVLSKGPAAVLDRYDPKRIGDQQLEFEVMLPADFTGSEVSVVVVGPAGESRPGNLVVGGEFPMTEDKEPNDGFRQAQKLAIPQIVNGSIHANHNVDVYSFEAQANETIVAEIFAARHRSILDGSLTLHDERGNLIAFADDGAGTLDPRMEIVIPTSGVFFLTVLDAHDRGSTFHGYRLKLHRAK